MQKNKFTLLTACYGIGRTTAKKIITLVDFTENKTEILNDFATNIRKFALFRVMHLKQIRSYRGLRSAAGLPIRGQRTHTNGKTLSYLVKNRLYLDLETIKEYHSIDILPTRNTFGTDKTKRVRRQYRAKKPKMYNTNLFKNKQFKKKDRMKKGKKTPGGKKKT